MSETKTVRRLEHDTEVRINELGRIWHGMQTAANIRDGGYQNRALTIDDLDFYLHNRNRVLLGLRAHTPSEWLEVKR